MRRLLFVLFFVTFALAAGELSSFIVNGNDAQPGQFPYMVSIRRVYDPKFHGCGGGILNEKWILTAAHCAYKTPTEDILVFVGSVKLYEGGTPYEIEKSIRHPSYLNNAGVYFSSNWHDIRVMKTTTKIIFNDLVQPVPLRKTPHPGNSRGILAGFGTYFSNITINRPPIEDLVMSPHLQYMEVDILSHFDCAMRTAVFNAINPFYPLKPIISSSSHLCATKKNGGACFGDSGSMLLSDGQVVGVVVSGVRLCGQVDAAPDIYTRVSSYINWIDNYIHDLE